MNKASTLNEANNLNLGWKPRQQTDVEQRIQLSEQVEAQIEKIGLNQAPSQNDLASGDT